MSTWDSAQPADAEVRRAYKLPYSVLVSDEDVECIKRGAVPKHLLRGDLDTAPGICAVEVHYPKPKKGKRRAADEEEWAEYWKSEVKKLAGKWVEVSVRQHRYSFEGATYSRELGAVEKVRRVGTRLVLESVEPAQHI